MAPNLVTEVRKSQDRAVGNFSAGPACLSEWVMRTAQEEFINKDGTGMGILEVCPEVQYPVLMSFPHVHLLYPF